ncbi:AAA family ATPase [Streptomyces sp. NA04227]|uniref:HelD family protein n=1 Tax=Streptomyces sp. NA04227 TaxID=2742136 RepID=UPI001590345E|nr:UvrD-helicase domain-containing protein [Streptomyces sp. NA04227]QKW09268.1 AAA family ATPase [Streptomyces sp. NA04227]
MRQEQQFVDRLYARVDALRGEAERSVDGALTDVGKGLQARLERDVLVAERSGLLAALNAVDGSLCFGRVDLAAGEDGSTPGPSHHIGRIGIREDDEEHTPILIDWRAPVARPFYLATGHTPMGLRRRRHLTTEGRTVTALHDEILDLGDHTRTGHEDPTGDAVLLAALDSARTGRMGDIVRTIQADQDRIIRAPHRGVLVVEGGPGTGKTAVALHRAAYLLYEHRELLARRAVLIVGPNPAFLGYIGEVLPSLGETGVLLASLGELFPGLRARGTESPYTAAVKGRTEMAEALALAVRDRQHIPEPGQPLVIAHEDGDLILDWETAYEARQAARDTLLPHNLARPHFAFRIIDSLTDQLVERIGADPYGGPNFLGLDDRAQLGKGIAASAEVHAAIDELWPELSPRQFVSDFLADPVYLPEQDTEALRRAPGSPWTPADVPLLDEAAELLGHDDSAALAAAEAERQERIAYAQGVLELSRGSESYEFEDEESELLSAHDIIDAERMAERHEEDDHRSAAERAAADRTWAFGHIIVDEAQDLSPMAWRLLMRRCPTRSMTLVGDPAQTAETTGAGAAPPRGAAAEGARTWQEILEPYVGDRWEHTRLGVNYRTPAEIMALAAAVLRAEHPAFEPPVSVRATGTRPWAKASSDLAATVAEAAAGEIPEEGRLAVIAPRALHEEIAARLPDVRAGEEPDLTRHLVLLDPRQAKGLEFDRVIVVEPGTLPTSDLYVALTRATQSLGLVHSGELPEPLRAALAEVPV